MRLFKYLRINRSYVFPGEVAELNDRLDFLTHNAIRFNTNRYLHGRYKMTAKFSLGTMNLNGVVGSPICVEMQVDEKMLTNPTVHFTSRVRIEHYIFIGIFVLAVVALLNSEQPWYISFYVFGVFLLCHFWFHMVYRVQENELINKVIGQLKLRDK